MLLQPEALLLDEPTSALDPDAEAAMENLLRQETARGLCAFIVTHSPAQAGRLCYRHLDLLLYSLAKQENNSAGESR